MRGVVIALMYGGRATRARIRILPPDTSMGQFERHVFVCTGGKTCGSQDSAATFQVLKDGLREAGMAQRIRANQAGCMGQCGHGPMVVVYPEDVWYAGVDAAGAKRILDEHLLGGTPVEALRYVAPPGEHKKPKDP